MPDINRQDERKHVFLNDLTGTVGSVFLGLGLGCAQCHDHKFDPISQLDFYRMRAFFDNTEVFVEQSVKATEDGVEPAGRNDGKAPTMRAVHNRTGNPQQSYLWIRGDFNRRGPEVTPAFLRVVGEDTADESTRTSAGTRTRLANWLTRPDHPLATRVVVNRIWQHHFGRGLSRSPSNFGSLGDAPTHPELLDWLATELPQRGWSLKELHRLIV
jgi:hypothetical protein